MPSTIIDNLDPEKPSFRPSKWPQKLKPTKNSKLPKLPENCFELVGRGGWPPISTWIRKNNEKTPYELWKGSVDNNLYIKVTQGNILLIEIYVDDIIFGSDDDKLSQKFAKDMQNEF
jgi:hypothetical protein